MSRQFPRRFLVGTILCMLFGWSFGGHKVYAQNRDNQNRLQPVQGLAVFDANGKRVGNVQGLYVESRGGTWGGAATVAFRFDGELVILYVGADGFTGEERGFTQNGSPLAFESANCTGTALISPPSILLPSLAPRHILQGTKLYRFEGSPKNAVLSSAMELPGPHCISFNPQEAIAQPLRFLTDLADHFQPPFTLR